MNAQKVITYYQCYQDTTYTTLSQTHIQTHQSNKFGLLVATGSSAPLQPTFEFSANTTSKQCSRALTYLNGPFGLVWNTLKDQHCDCITVWNLIEYFVLESCWYMSTNSSSCLNPQVALHITIISPISQTKFINVEKWKTLHCSLPEWHFECCNTANNANIAWWTL